MKRLMIFTFLFVALLSLVSAQITCPSPNDVILRLSNSTNAHGEVWSSTSYTTEVCYSQIFGQQYPGPNPQQCSAGNANKVLKLSSTGNAHAEVPEAGNYSTFVCYGDLVCNSVPGNTNCGANMQEVVSLSEYSNAHLETKNANTYTSLNNYKVCCTSPSSFGQIASANWIYFNGQPIPPNTLMCPNSYLGLNAQTIGVPDGTSVTFQVYEQDGLGNDDSLGGPLPGTIQNDQATFFFDLSDPLIRSALQGALGEVGEGSQIEMFFNVTIPSDSEVSQIVNYVDDAGQCSYQGPTAAVTAPVHTGVYFKNTQVEFISGCSSTAGPLVHSWEITQNGQTYTNTNAQFNLTFGQTFGDTGQALVRLTCTDLQGLSATAEAQILVVASPFTFAYISAPAFNGVVYSTPVSGVPYFPKNAPFTAVQSYAVDATGCTISCIGGACPANTQNSPTACGGGPITINNAPSPGNADYSNLNFDWTFWDNNWNNAATSYDGSGRVNGTAVYDDLSSNVNDKHISVTVQASGSSATFQRDFTLGRCLNNGNTFYSPSGQLISTTLENNACKGGDGIDRTADDCCPGTVLECLDNDVDGTHTCDLPAIIVTKCEDYATQSQCNGNINPNIPQASYGQNNLTACQFLECAWISDTAGCGVHVVEYPSTTQNGCDVTGTPISNCAWTTTQTACVNGQKTISYQSSTPGCSRPSVTVPCGSLSFELSYFGYMQFIVCAMIIALIYYFGRKKL